MLNLKRDCFYFTYVLLLLLLLLLSLSLLTLFTVENQDFLISQGSTKIYLFQFPTGNERKKLLVAMGISQPKRQYYV